MSLTDWTWDDIRNAAPNTWVSLRFCEDDDDGNPLFREFIISDRDDTEWMVGLEDDNWEANDVPVEELENEMFFGEPAWTIWARQPPTVRYLDQLEQAVKTIKRRSE